MSTPEEVASKEEARLRKTLERLKYRSLGSNINRKSWSINTSQRFKNLTNII